MLGELVTTLAHARSFLFIYHLPCSCRAHLTLLSTPDTRRAHLALCSRLPNEKSSVHNFYVGQRIHHKAKNETGTIVNINVGNLRQKPFEVQFDSGETHQYTEDALNHKFTVEDVDEGYRAITSPRDQIHEHTQVTRE